MAEMKNICGKIPLELHTKVRQEIEQREISTQQFIQEVIEEHFREKGGHTSMAGVGRTLAVQVSEELFARLKAAVAKKGCKQKDFLIALIERAVEESEAEFEAGKAAEAPEEETGIKEEPVEPEGERITEGKESEETARPEEAEESGEPIESEPEDSEQTAETEEDATEPEDSAKTEPGEAEAQTEEALESKIA